MKPSFSESSATDRAAHGGVKVGGKVLEISPRGTGIKTWGAVDYLVKVHGYAVVRPAK